MSCHNHISCWNKKEPFPTAKHTMMTTRIAAMKKASCSCSYPVLVVLVVVIISPCSTAFTNPAVPSEPSNLRQWCDVTERFESRPSPKLLRHIHWLHVPKAGTSFGTTIMHYACENLDDDLYPHKQGQGFEYMRYFFQRYYKPKYCSGRVHLEHVYGHAPLNEEAIRKGGVVAMLRDPRMRHYSGWRIHGVMGTPLHPSNLTEYVQMYRGCQMKMILGEHCELKPGRGKRYWRPSSHDEAKRAASLLQDEAVFAFVGLTDHWKASVCLFHAMFGGNITKHEMDNVRPGVSALLNGNSHPALEKISMQEDPFDAFVYTIARQVFVRRLLEFGIAVPEELQSEG
ncbi:hypothetical protein PTSG_13088 [Salpingoeca rosetta]|uniref:Sulfotransferase domain-containing protein n=1 Tax=Salpingoeca rosetta (strain ATCC 50818 / BSB-021) TaxID=946362 RepID=F2UQ48_SALR5|nr:uncharacterized protein PTSG_13088 [Salpingoeca rosetta]EGD79716.1 hypothetical protein PTSG_13088 [Salpingoeca rosetta]|eukprot:XP_004988666.1 hypothetical protein PTSG_13088 [Salpingoeca rosetta]